MNGKKWREELRPFPEAEGWKISDRETKEEKGLDQTEREAIPDGSRGLFQRTLHPATIIKSLNALY